MAHDALPGNLQNIYALTLMQASDFTRRNAEWGVNGLHGGDQQFSIGAAKKYEGLCGDAFKDGLTSKELKSLGRGMGTLNQAMKDGDITPQERKQVRGQLKQAKALVSQFHKRDR